MFLLSCFGLPETQTEQRFIAYHNTSQTTKPSDSTPSISDGEIMVQQLERHRLLSNVCSQLPNVYRSSNPDWYHFYVDDRRKYIYCKVEKVACTTWKRTLLDLTGQVSDARKLGFYKVHSEFYTQYIRNLDSYKPSEIEYRLKNYYKFMFTRHPFERLVSAYRSKIQREKAYRKLRKMLARQRHGGSRSEFVNFVRFVIAQVKSGRELDTHWQPQNVICRPCHVNYDFIGRYESLYQDADYVLNRIGRASPEVVDTAGKNATLPSLKSKDASPNPEKLKFPRSDQDNKLVNSRYLVDKMMALLSPDDIAELYKLYEVDFRLYGYTNDKR